MILAPSLIDTALDRDYVINLCANLAQTYNVVVLTSSGELAVDWIAKGATYFAEDSFADGVRKLRDPASKMKFAVFAQRFDGVDLPDDACRVLVIDGVPYGSGLVDKVDSEMTVTPGGTRNRTIYRIEQGMGRPVRSHADFAVVLLVGADLTTYVGRKDVLESMTPDSRNQLNLCIELADMVRKAPGGNPDAAIRQVIGQCLQRDAGWKSYYNHKIREAPKDVAPIDVARIDLANQERVAHVMAQDNMLVDAMATLNKAIHEAELSNEERGMYLQRLSRIAYLSDPPEAMKLQQSARSRNRALAIPPSLPRRPPTLGGKTVAQKMLAWFDQFANPNAAVLQAKRILDELNFSRAPKKVEATLMQLGEALGANSSRPDEEYRDGGPDNLWFWGSHAFVIEAKTGNEKSLHKTDSGQLHHSLQWTKETYPEFADRMRPLVVAKVTALDDDAHYPVGTRVLTQERCTAMATALFQLTQKLSDIGPIFRTVDVVLGEMHAFGLHPDQFLQRHTVELG